jgi:hypothetical protein
MAAMTARPTLPLIAGGRERSEGFARCLARRRKSLVPPWMEILIDLIGYAGFVALAVYHPRWPAGSEAVRDADRANT